MIFRHPEGETKIANSLWKKQKETSNKQLKPTPGIDVNRLDSRKIVHKNVYTITKRSFLHGMSNNSTVRKKTDFLYTEVGLSLFSMLQHFLK